jgi:glycosyltransferase involved in cell wall biosynthesis
MGAGTVGLPSIPLPAELHVPRSAKRDASADGERRVLMVAPEPFYEDRGTPIAVRNVLDALSELHYEVDLLTYPVGQPIAIPGLQVLRSPNPFGIRRVPIGLSFRKLLLDATLVPAMWLQLRRRRYCCIHAVEEAAFPAVMLGRYAGVPVIYDMQASLPEQLVKHRAFRGKRVQAVLHRCEAWLLRRADAVVSSAGLLQKVGETAPGKLAREWHFPTPLTVLPEGAGAALRAELSIPARAPVVVYAGTFEPYQGLQTLLAAIGLVLEAVPDSVFVLVGGEGAAAEEIGREAARLRLDRAIRLLGRKPRAEMPAYLAMADLLVSPRCYGDNLPLKVFDYLAAGRPIVATDLPAHRALLDESRAVLTEATAAGLARGIIDVLRDPSRASGLAHAARTYAATHLGWDRFVVAVKAIYDEVALGACARSAG